MEKILVYLQTFTKIQYHFHHDRPNCLHLFLGDKVVILRENGDWYYGYEKRNKFICGIFPKSFVQLDKERQQPSNQSSEILIEISALLTEAQKRLRTFYLTNNNVFKQLCYALLDLIDLRTEIMLDRLTAKDMLEVNLLAISNISLANSLLEIDRVSGDLMENVMPAIDRTSTVDLFRLNSIAKNGRRGYHRIQSSLSHPYNLFLTVCRLVCDMKTDLLFTLFDGDKMKPISENAFISWAHPSSSFHTATVQFSDISSDLRDRKVYLVCRAVRCADSLRRAFGLAYCDLSEVLRRRLLVRFPIQVDMTLVKCGWENFDCTLQRLIAAAAVQEVEAVEAVEPNMTIRLAVLDAEMTRRYSIMHNNYIVARTIDFPVHEAKHCMRNDLYLTLVSGDFARNSNIDVIVAVYNDLGGLVPDAISIGAGAPTVSEYRSLVYRNDDQWNESLRIRLPIETFKRCHIRFTVKSHDLLIAKEPTMLGNAKLMLMLQNGDALPNQKHDLIVENSKLDNNSPSGTDSLTIETNLCSWGLSQDERVLELVKWRKNRPSKNILEHILTTFDSIRPEEVAKALPDILDVLFEILSRTWNPTIDELAFDCLLKVVVLLRDKSFASLCAPIDLYTSERFSEPLVYGKLVDLATNKINSDNDRRLLQCLPYMLMFIARSRQLNGVARVDHFEAKLKKLLNQLICKCLTSKSLLWNLRAIGDVLPLDTTELMEVYTAMELCQFVVLLVNDIYVHKLSIMNELINSKLFRLQDCRTILLPLICAHIKKIWDKNQEVPECLDLLNNITNMLFHRAFSGPAHDIITTLVGTLLPVVIKTVINSSASEQTRCQMVNFILGCLRSMTSVHYQWLVRQLAHTELHTFILDILYFAEDIEWVPAFPASWSDMHLHQNTIIVRCLHHIGNCIEDQFYAPFDRVMWSRYFRCCVQFITQPSLQLESFDEGHKLGVLRRHGDVRLQAAIDIWHMWKVLYEHAPDFVLELVGPMLEMSVLAEPKLRLTTITIFFDMLRCAMPSTGHPQGFVEQFELEMVSRLEQLIEVGCVDEDYPRTFRGILLPLFAGDRLTCKTGDRFVRMIAGWAEVLIRYRAVVKDACKENRLACAAALLEHCRLHVHHMVIYMQCVDKLLALHEELANWAEVAFTMRLHWDMVRWSDAELSEAMLKRWPAFKTHRQLKEHMGKELIGTMNRAELWQCAFDLGTEMVQRCDDNRMMHELHNQLRRSHAKIVNKRWQMCQYYRVAFYGEGFAAVLRNRVFVYRFPSGIDVFAHLIEQHPAAEVWESTEAHEERITKTDGQHIIINVVEPIAGRAAETSHRYFGFAHTYRGRNVADAGSLWMEHTELRTHTGLPGILPWAEVKETTVYNDIREIKHMPERNLLD